MTALTDAFATISPFVIGAHTYTGEYLVGILGFSANIYQDMQEVAGWVAFWGAQRAEAKKAHADLEAQYRTARDAFILEKTTAEKKMAKTNAELAWRTEPTYAEWQDRIQEAAYAWDVSHDLYEAFQAKARMLTATTKLMADERYANPRP